jgi:hypothetical protein
MITFLLTFLVSAFANACPQLAGDWKTVGRTGSEIIRVNQQDCQNLTISVVRTNASGEKVVLVSNSYIFDGVKREVRSPEPGMKTLMQAMSYPNRFVITVEFRDKFSNVFFKSFVEEVFLNQNGQMVEAGRQYDQQGKLIDSFQVIHEREKSKVILKDKITNL